MNTRNKNRAILLLLTALFVAPLAVAWLLVDQWRPAGHTHHGELLEPAQPVAYFRLRQSDGSELSEEFLQRRWTLAYVSDVCERVCRDSLYHMRQLRLAQGKDMGRLQTLFLMSTEPEQEFEAWLAEEHPDLAKGVADHASRDFFEQAFPGQADGPWIYLIDPLGNLFMRYSTDTDPSGIRKDLKRLLKLSRIG